MSKKTNKMDAPASKKPRTSSAHEEPKLSIIMNGLPGAMGLVLADLFVSRGMPLADFALTGPGMPASVEVKGVTVRLLDATSSKPEFEAEVAKLRHQGLTPIAIDFSTPLSVNPNADLYNQLDLPFVMGTTGGDREALGVAMEKSTNTAVIAPNMCKPIVALMAMFEMVSKEFPGAFKGLHASVAESHQRTKLDTSGTAKALSRSLEGLLGEEIPEEAIVLVRTDEDSLKFGVRRWFGVEQWTCLAFTLAHSQGVPRRPRAPQVRLAQRGQDRAARLCAPPQRPRNVRRRDSRGFGVPCGEAPNQGGQEQGRGVRHGGCAPGPEELTMEPAACWSGREGFLMYRKTISI
jgi:4-hydroxy-tetrahydrodipicolinate reductase